MAKSKQIAKLLKADISMTSNLAEIAKMLEKKGRGGDTILAHITRREAEMLKDMGGAGTVNPETGLLEFYDGDYSEFQPTESQYGAFGEAPAPAPQGYESTSTETFIGSPEASQASPGVYLPRINANLTTEDVVSRLPQFNAVEYYKNRGAPSPTPGGPTIPETVAPAGRAAYYAGQDIQDQLAGAAGTDLSKPLAVPAPEKSFLKDLAAGLTSQDMIRLGLAGGLGLIGQQQAKKAAGQAGQAAEEQRALGVPYQTKGKEMVRAAEAGELTPTGQQALRAVQAQVAQGVEQRGGVGAAQAAAQVEAFRQQLLQQQYNYGLQVAQIGDSIALGAIKTGLQADQAVQQATNQFYTSLASVAAGLPLAGFAQRTTT